MLRTAAPRRTVARVVALALALTVLAVGGVRPAGAAGPSVLLVYSAYSAQSDHSTNVADGLTATGQVGTVTTFDGGAATPSASDLVGIDVVMVMADGGWNDNAALGDLLADFVDAGGTVVETTFTLYCAGVMGLAGRWASGGYGALIGPNPDCPNQLDGDGPLGFVATDASSPLLAGVTTFNGGTSSYRNVVGVAPGATLVARWDDEDDTPFAAWTAAHTGCVVGLNFYPPSSDASEDFWDATTDGFVLQANAVNFACGATPPPPPPEPEPVVVEPTFTG